MALPAILYTHVYRSVDWRIRHKDLAHSALVAAGCHKLCWHSPSFRFGCWGLWILYVSSWSIATKFLFICFINNFGRRSQISDCKFQGGVCHANFPSRTKHDWLLVCCFFPLPWLVTRYRGRRLVVLGVPDSYKEVSYCQLVCSVGK